MLFGLHGFHDDYFHVHDQILGSPIVSNFTSTCSILLYVLGKHTTNITPHVDDSSALVSQHNDRTLPHKSAKGVTSVTIVANLATKFTYIMPYMVVLLNLLQLSKLLLCNLLLWKILHLIRQTNLLLSMNFLNGMKIVRTLVPLLLLRIQVHILLASLTLLPLALGF